MGGGWGAARIPSASQMAAVGLRFPPCAQCRGCRAAPRTSAAPRMAAVGLAAGVGLQLRARCWGDCPHSRRSLYLIHAPWGSCGAAGRQQLGWGLQFLPCTQTQWWGTGGAPLLLLICVLWGSCGAAGRWQLGAGGSCGAAAPLLLCSGAQCRGALGGLPSAQCSVPHPCPVKEL